MKLLISAEVDLDAQAGREPFITWLDIRLVAGDMTAARARAALFHVGELTDAHASLSQAVGGTALKDLVGVYFEDDWYKDDFADGAGIDLLYFERVSLEPGFEGRNLDLALMRRVAETMGSGCQLAVVPYDTPGAMTRLKPMGFEISTPGRSRGFAHVKLGARHAHLVDATGAGHFEVLALGAFGGGGAAN